MPTKPVSTTPHRAPAPDRRTRDRERRRNQVYDAAVALFVERGFDSTTMDEVAERADVARATVFNHFARKTAFLDEWSARRRRRALDAVYSEHLEDHSVREILERYMVELAKVSTDTRVETVAVMGAAVNTANAGGHPALAHELAGILRRRQSKGELASTANPEVAGLLLATGYFGVVTAWIDTEPPAFDLLQRLLIVVSIVLDGISPVTPEQAKPTSQLRR